MAELEGQERLIDGRFVVNTARKLVGAGGGVAAFAVRDLRGGHPDLMALQVADHAPPRASAIERLVNVTSTSVLLPIAQGPAPGPDGRDRYFVICPAPPGPALNAAGGAWNETALVENVVRPIAAALALLESSDVTHRAIRPDNLFSVGAKQPAVLGAAWAAPPASLQPAVFEPPYCAMCPPAARGDGSIADDIYALGVTLVALATGRAPLAGLPDNEVVRRKLELGSYQAVVGEHRLPPIIDDLVRGMLAEDQLHRPVPQTLLDTSTARTRRVALRPVRRGQRPLQVAGIAAGDARTLAYAMAVHPEEGLRLLRAGTIGGWIREVLRDLTLAHKVDEALRQRGPHGADAPGRAADGADDPPAANTLAMQVIALLDPLAPLCWHGVALWPNGMGPLLAAEPRRPDLLGKLEDLVEQEALSVWAAARPDRCDVGALRREAMRWRRILADKPNGALRLRYELNPLLCCGGPALGSMAVARIADLLPGLEAASANPDLRKAPPLDLHVAAFIAAHRGDRMLSEPGMGELGLDRSKPGFGAPSSDDMMRQQIRLLARMQARMSPPQSLPGLATWLAEHAGPIVATWHNRERRTQLLQSMPGAARAGNLVTLVALLDDPAARSADKHGLQAATETIARIDAEVNQLLAGSASRQATARRLGREVAAGLGLTTLAVVLATLVLA